MTFESLTILSVFKNNNNNSVSWKGSSISSSAGLPAGLVDGGGLCTALAAPTAHPQAQSHHRDIFHNLSNPLQAYRRQSDMQSHIFLTPK